MTSIETAVKSVVVQFICIPIPRCPPMNHRYTSTQGRRKKIRTQGENYASLFLSLFLYWAPEWSFLLEGPPSPSLSVWDHQNHFFLNTQEFLHSPVRVFPVHAKYPTEIARITTINFKFSISMDKLRAIGIFLIFFLFFGFF